jgi:hypothetical protein
MTREFNIRKASLTPDTLTKFINDHSNFLSKVDTQLKDHYLEQEATNRANLEQGAKAFSAAFKIISDRIHNFIEHTSSELHVITDTYNVAGQFNYDKVAHDYNNTTIPTISELELNPLAY